MMKKSLLSTTLLSLLFVGCAGQYKGGNYLPSPDEVGNMIKPKVSKEQSINNSHDKYLTETFINSFQTSRDVKMNIKKSSIEIEKLLFSSDLNVQMKSAENFYKGKSSGFLNDDVATLYKDAVKKRGNYVNVYKGQMNYKIFSSIIGKLNRGNAEKLYAYGLDFALIEFDKNDQIQSALVRAAIVIPEAIGIAMGDKNPPVNIEQNSVIFFKDKMSICEMTIPNEDFKNYLVKSFK